MSSNFDGKAPYKCSVCGSVAMLAPHEKQDWHMRHIRHAQHESTLEAVQ